MKSVLMIGQSNMAGRGFIEEVPAICNERIQMLRNGRWQMMEEPVNYDRPVSGISPAVSFAAMWCLENKKEKIGLIPCAEGGSSLDDWSADKILFRNAVFQTKFALQNSELICILWHQGENDSYEGRYQTYYDKLKVLSDTLRKELNAPDVPFLIGGLADFLGKYGFGRNCTEYEQINCELLRFAREQKNTYFVTARGLTSNPDGIHINAVSQRKFGVRYYEAFSKRTHVLHPLKNELNLLEPALNRPYTKGEQLYLTMSELALGKITYEEFARRFR